MDVFDQILEHLELERELGTRTVEIDRALLMPLPRSKPPAAEPHLPPAASTPPPAAAITRPADGAGDGPQQPCDILFLTGRPLSAAGTEAMERIVAAMKRIRPDLRISISHDGKARGNVVVFIGSDALKKHMPSVRPVRGRWIEYGGASALMTFSPDYIFSHFQEGSPRMVKAKLDMWNDIKSAIAHLPA